MMRKRNKTRQKVPNLVPAAIFVNGALVIHLVDEDHQALDAQRFGQHRMLARLATSLKPSLELALSCGDHQHANISLKEREKDHDGTTDLCSAFDHVRNVVFVAGGIQQGKSLVNGGKMGSANFNSLSFRALLFVGVHDVCQIPTLAVLLFGFLFVLGHRSFINLVGQQPDSSL